MAVANELLKIPKHLRPVTLWVHPEGRVIGSLFLRKQSPHHAGQEEPVEVLNQDEAFLVVKRDHPDELRFYNRASIVRVEYETTPGASLPDVKVIPCRIHMMDGSLITGTIRQPLPPDRSRLFDYLNQPSERFVKLHVKPNLVLLINKSYIIQATSLEESDVSDS